MADIVVINNVRYQRRHAVRLGLIQTEAHADVPVDAGAPDEPEQSAPVDAGAPDEPEQSAPADAGATGEDKTDDATVPGRRGRRSPKKKETS